MMNLMSLISEHHFSIFEVFVVNVVMECCSTRPTSANGSIWLNPTAEVSLFTVIFKERLNLAFSLPRFDLSHNSAVCLTSDPSRPSHNFNLLIVFVNSRFSKDVVHEICIGLSVWTNGLIELVLTNSGHQSWVTVLSEVDINNFRLFFFEIVFDLINVPNFVDQRIFLLLFFKILNSHPDLVKVV